MAGQQPDPTGAKILDAAVRVLGDFGFKRATVELVAKYAGVSHMTIYRRWPSKGELLQTAVLQEFNGLLDDAFAAPTTPDASFADRTVDAFADVVWKVRTNPLVVRELNTETGDLLAVLPTTSSAVMETVVPLVTEHLTELAEETDGAVEDIDALADVFVRMAHSLVLVDRPGHALATKADVAGYAREFFVPYLKGLAAEPDPVDIGAQIVEFPSPRPQERPNRIQLQIAAASLLGVLLVGAGLSAFLGSTGKLPFIKPANASETNIPAPAPQAPGSVIPAAGDLTGPPAVVPADAPSDQTAPPAVAGPAATAPRASVDPGVPPVVVPRGGGQQSGGGGQTAGPTVALAPAPAPIRPTPPPPKPGPAPGPGPQPGPGPKPGPPPAPGPAPGPGPAPQPGPGPGPGPGPNQGPGPGPGPNR